MQLELVNKLEEALINAQNFPEEIPRFYEVLMQSQVYVIQEGEIPAEHGKRTLQTGYKLRIRPILINQTDYLPIFSSLEKLKKNLTEEVGYIALNAVDLFQCISGANVVLNPGSQYGKLFSVEEIRSLAERSIFKPNELVIQETTEIKIGPPSEYPKQLVEALTRLFKQHKEVKRAWIAIYFNPKSDEKPHTIIGIDASSNYKSICGKVGAIITNTHIPEPPVDICHISNSSGFGSYFLNESNPFYVKEKSIFQKILGL
ncbi:MAG: enhanced serine sensitivity protein SseB C-terminal domain-containing protein [Flavobacteriales bacterium]|nr:enhanced serine sensitivity protein SseB C-terminal domain-containing protein [Flavobacteriales bacterium]